MCVGILTMCPSRQADHLFVSEWGPQLPGPGQSRPADEGVAGLLHGAACAESANSACQCFQNLKLFVLCQDVLLLAQQCWFGGLEDVGVLRKNQRDVFGERNFDSTLCSLQLDFFSSPHLTGSLQAHHQHGV